MPDAVSASRDGRPEGSRLGRCHRVGTSADSQASICSFGNKLSLPGALGTWYLP